ncbi:hypothetical protein ABZ922_31580 [Streptomyces shenzhenensis]|uniref:hypothetical protein n=1 Tax=Streptomyces shenzhenensis TaxID=943815 RepID=UPI0033E576A4
MTVKADMPTLYRRLERLPRTVIPAASAVSTGHGRRARRTIEAVPAPAWIEFGVMASLRGLVVSLLCLDGRADIAAADRHHARDSHRTLKPLHTA